MKLLKAKPLIVATAMAVMLLGSTMTVYATPGNGTNSTISTYVNENGGDMPASIKSNFFITQDANEKESKGAEYNCYTYMAEDGTATYYLIKSEQEQTVASRIDRQASSSGLTTDLDANILDGYELGADTKMATDLMRGFFPIVRTLLGIIVVCVTAGMTVFSAFDLSYIAFPVFRNKCEEHKTNGGVMAKQGKGGETKLRFITDDAQYAVTAADTVQSGKNPFMIYFGKRMLSYIVLAILIFILLTGNINIFAKLALQVVQGILDLINGF